MNGALVIGAGPAGLMAAEVLAQAVKYAIVMLLYRLGYSPDSQ